MEGCDDSAEAAVTRGCLRERERSREVERFADADADADLGLGRIFHSGSCDSTWAFHAFASAGAVRPTTIVMDSLSEMSKLWIEVGVSADCCGLRLGDSIYWRVTLVDGGLLLLSSAALKVCSVGDLAGAVLALARGEFETSGDGAFNTGVPARNVGVPARNVGVARPAAGNNDSRADGGFETVGDVARRGMFGSGKLSSSSYFASAKSLENVVLGITYLDQNLVHCFGFLVICFLLSPLV